MPNGTRTEKRNLKEIIASARSRWSDTAGRAISDLRETASELGMRETEQRLGRILDRLESDTFQIIVVGRFNNGKSTILNALLGAPPGSHKGLYRGPLPTDLNPCTAVLTVIRYADKPYVKACGFDGSSKEWSLERYLEDSMVEYDERENQEKFKDIRNFELGFPTELCRSGVTLVDSPGTDDMDQRTRLTREAVSKADAAVVVYRSDSLAGQGEREFVSDELLSTRTRVFTVVNRFHGTRVTRRMKGFVWQRLITALRGGPKYEGQDPEDRDIFFVDALAAEEGRFKGDDELVESSGLAALERRLGRFLVDERHQIHLDKFTSAASREATALEKHLGQRRAALQKETLTLEEASTEIQPKLEEVYRRRDQVGLILTRYARRAADELDMAFQLRLTELSKEIPIRMAERPLSTLDNWKERVVSFAKKRRVVEEAEQHYKEIVDQAINEWLDAPQEAMGARRVLAGVVDEMCEEISEEVGEIERSFEDLQLDLIGWEPRYGTVSEDGTLGNQILGVVAVCLTGNIGLGIGGATGGWRGLVGAAGGGLAALVGLSLLSAGFTIAPILGVGTIMLGNLAGSIVGDSLGRERRVKEKVIDELTPRLEEVGRSVREHLTHQTRTLFQELETEVMDELRSVIEAEEQNIRKMLEENARSRQEKADLLARLDAVRQRIEGHLRSLRQIGAEIAQVA